MNPTIKEFWDKIGEVDLTPSAPIRYYLVKLYSNNQYLSIAEIWRGGPQDGPAQPDKYYYNDIEYTEEEMLKVIEQKAFL